MFHFNHKQSRPNTCKLLDLAEQGMLDWEQIARDALGWMSEHEVTQFAQANDYGINDDDEEVDEDEE